MLLSTVSAYVALAAIRDDAARERAWADQYEATWPDVFATYYSSWGDRGRRAEASAAVLDLVATIQRREQRAVQLVTDADDRLRQAGLMDGAEMDVVLLVGGRTSNGWVTTFRGRPTLFLALEFLAEPPYDEILVTHESLHVAHHRLRGADGRTPSQVLSLPRAWRWRCPGGCSRVIPTRRTCGSTPTTTVG